ncbi:unnamed protein product [Closterium sp. Naga37s-1]|nr:unnamed protein product [Closterium sp. Naga37s-1]
MPAAENIAEAEGSDGGRSAGENPAGVVGSAEMGGLPPDVGGTAEHAHALPHVAAEITDPRGGVSLDADEGDGATCTKLDTEEEMKSLSRVIAAYMNYPFAADWTVQRWERAYARLPPRQQFHALLIPPYALLKGSAVAPASQICLYSHAHCSQCPLSH